MNTKEDKIKFLVFSAAYPYRGGISDSTHSLCNELIKSGVNTEVWTFSLLYPSFLFPGKSQFSNEGYVQNFKITRVINTMNPFNWVRVSKMANKIMPESIILRYWSPILVFPYFFIGLLLNKRIKIIGLIDNWDNHEKVPFEKLLRKFFLNTCEKFITMSDNVGRQVEKSTDKKVLSLFHPINLNLPKPMDKKIAKVNLGLSDKTYICFVGLIRKYKGLDLLLDALPNFPENVELIVAGEFYDYASEYKAQISKLGIGNKVHFFSDFIPKNKVNLFFSACDMVVQPYKSATQSGVAQIAYHFNKPILVTNVGGLPEIVPHKKVGYVVDVHSDAIVEAVNDFYAQNRELYFIENARIEKEKYSWSNMASHILKSD